MQSKHAAGDSASSSSGSRTFGEGEAAGKQKGSGRSAVCVDCDQVLEGVRGYGDYSQMLLVRTTSSHLHSLTTY
jgi:hypothetical protein